MEFLPFFPSSSSTPSHHTMMPYQTFNLFVILLFANAIMWTHSAPMNIGRDYTVTQTDNNSAGYSAGPTCLPKLDGSCS